MSTSAIASKPADITSQPTATNISIISSLPPTTTLHIPKVDSRSHFNTFCQDVNILLNGLSHPVMVGQMSQMDAAIIQSTLPRLDDYTALLEAFRVSSVSLQQELSLIQQHTIDHAPAFIERVNRFDEYVTNVEACCVELEKRISQAEDAYVSHSALSTAGLAKIFSSVTSQSSPHGSTIRVSTQPIEIVSSADYINQPQSAQQAVQ